MNIVKEDIDKLNAKVKIKVEKEDYEERVENVLKDYRKQALIDGFRPGKVPFGIIRKMYYKPVLADEINKIVSESITRFLVDEKIDILGEPLPNEEEHPEIDWENDTGFEFVFDLGLAPEFELSIAPNDKIPYYKIKVDDKMIGDYTKDLTRRMGNYEIVEVIADEALIKGDLVQLDDNNLPLEDGIKTEDASILMSVIKDEKIKKCLIGKKVNDTVILSIKKAYPNEQEIASILKIDKEEAENVDADFQLQIKEISQFKDAEINQDFYDRLYGKDIIETKEDFKKRLIDDIERSLVNDSEYRFFIDTKESLLKKAKFDLPDEFLKRWILLSNKGKFTQEDIDKDYEGFKEDLRWQLIKDKIGKDNEIKVSEEEAMEYAKRLSVMQLQQYGYMNLPDDQLEMFAKSTMKKEEERRKVYEQKLEEKIIEYVKATVKVDNKSITKEKFDKLFDKK